MSSVRCYFSGVESPQHWRQCVSVGVRNALMSYWQFGERTPNLVRQRKQSNPKVRFMIDSGAHSFIVDWTKFKNWTRGQFDDYVKRYVNWIRENRKYVDCVVEFDIDYCLNMVLAGNQNAGIGSSIVEGWQRQYFRPLENEGISVIYVWHTERGVEGWEDMCARFAYVGLPGEMSKDSAFNKFMSVAKRYSTKVHGFAATKQLDFRDVDWFSIDSITWKTGEMYGTLIVWDENAQRLSFVDKPDRFKYRNMIKARGFDADVIVADRNYKEVTRFSLDSMRRMEKFYADKYASRQFYYETRLAPPTVVQGCPVDAKYLAKKWNLMRPDEKFKKHANASEKEIRSFLAAISAVQYGDSNAVQNNKVGHDFLKEYFPSLASPLVSDMRIFQKEMAIYTAPPNPPLLQRTDAEHYSDTNPSKKRDEEFSKLLMSEARTPAPRLPFELLQNL